MQMSLSIYDIKIIAKNILTVDVYHDQLKRLKDDIAFFNMYMQRLKTSDFDFDIRIKSPSGRLFDKIFAQYAYDQSNLDDVYAVYTVLECLFKELHQPSGKLSKLEQKKIVRYFKQIDIDIEQLVPDVINCSQGCTFVRNEIRRLTTEIDNGSCECCGEQTGSPKLKVCDKCANEFKI